MSQLIDVVNAFFTADNWNAVQVEGETALIMRFQGDHGEFHCQAATHEEDHIFIFHSLVEVNYPEGRREVMMEFLTRVNFGMYIGNFEMDVDGNQIRFKTSIDVEDHGLSFELIRNHVYSNCLTMDRHIPGIAAIINTQISVVDALALVDSGA